jgi:hypothetical protein
MDSVKISNFNNLDQEISMTETIEQAKTRLEKKSVRELREIYEGIYQQTSTSRHKHYLIKRILWGMQANTLGGLSLRAASRAKKIADVIDIRLTPPQEQGVTVSVSAPPGGELMPGMQLERIYKGRKVIVTIAENGVRFEGKLYRSLTAVAKEVTGSHWNGRQFFGLGGKTA